MKPTHVAALAAGGVAAALLGYFGFRALTASKLKARPAVVPSAGMSGIPRNVAAAIPGTAGTAADVANYTQAGANAVNALQGLKTLFGGGQQGDAAGDAGGGADAAGGADMVDTSAMDDGTSIPFADDETL